MSGARELVFHSVIELRVRPETDAEVWGQEGLSCSAREDAVPLMETCLTF